jgi:hypothetical protein
MSYCVSIIYICFVLNCDTTLTLFLRLPLKAFWLCFCRPMVNKLAILDMSLYTGDLVSVRLSAEYVTYARIQVHFRSRFYEYVMQFCMSLTHT